MNSFLKVILSPSFETNLAKSEGDEQPQVPTDQP